MRPTPAAELIAESTSDVVPIPGFRRTALGGRPRRPTGVALRAFTTLPPRWSEQGCCALLRFVASRALPHARCSQAAGVARCFASTTRRCDIGERRRYEPGTFCWVGLATSDPGEREGLLHGSVRLACRGPGGGSGWRAIRRFATAARRWRSSTCSSRRRGRRARRRIGPRISRSRMPTRWRRAPASSAAPRSSASPSTCSTPAAWPRSAIRPARSCRSGSRAHASVPRSSMTSAPCAGTSWRRPTSSRAKSFFDELLGWEYETDESGYVSIRNAGRLNGGMRKQSEQEPGIPRTGSRISRSRPPTKPRAKRRTGRTHASADHGGPHRARRGDRRSSGRHVRGVRGRDRPDPERRRRPSQVRASVRRLRFARQGNSGVPAAVPGGPIDDAGVLAVPGSNGRHPACKAGAAAAICRRLSLKPLPSECGL